MRPFKAIPLAIMAAFLLWQPAKAGPTPIDDQSASEAELTIGFSPPLGERLFYRSRRVSKAPSGDETSERIFAIRFEREGDGFRMIATQINQGSRATQSSRVPPILIEQTFHLDTEGSLIGMEDEPAYWAAIESILQGEKDAREREAMMQVMRDTRALPLRDRLNWISDKSRSIIAFAGVAVPTAPVEYPAVRRTVVGPVVGRVHLRPERVTAETIVLNETWQIPPEQLEQVLAELTVRFGRESAEYGNLVRAQATRSRVELDRLTGLVRRYTQVQETGTERDGVSLITTTNETVERIARGDLEPR